jgi:hypothetical protein
MKLKVILMATFAIKELFSQLTPLPRWAYTNLIWGLYSLFLLSVYYTKNSLFRSICIKMFTIKLNHA